MILNFATCSTCVTCMGYTQPTVQLPFAPGPCVLTSRNNPFPVPCTVSIDPCRNQSHTVKPMGDTFQSGRIIVPLNIAQCPDMIKHARLLKATQHLQGPKKANCTYTFTKTMCTYMVVIQPSLQLLLQDGKCSDVDQSPEGLCHCC